MEIVKQHLSEIIMGATLLMALACIAGSIGSVCVLSKKGVKRDSRNAAMPLLFFVCVWLGYGCMIWSKHYSVDSFNVMYDMSPYWHLQLGRYINCGTILWADFFGMNQVTQQQFFMLLWSIVLTVMMWLFYQGIVEFTQPDHGWKKVCIAGAVALTFLNVFAMELMLFPEMAMTFLLGNLGLGLAVRYALSGISLLKRWALAALFLLIALGCYQSYIGIFEAFVLMGIFLKWKEDARKRYTESFIALVIGCGASAVNIIMPKILIHFDIIADSGRGASLTLGTIAHNFIEMAKYQIRFWKNADGLLPGIVMPVIGVIAVVALVAALKSLSSVEQRSFFCILIAGLYVLGYAPHLVEGRIDLTPRSNIAIWSVIAVLLIAAVVLQKQKTDQKRPRPAELVVAGILVVQVITMQDMAANEQAMNVIDWMEAEEIARVVTQYEEETGNVISQVAVCGDENMTVYQPLSRYRNSQLGARIMAIDYSNYRLIGAVLHRDLHKVEMPQEVYQTHFSGKNWDELNVEEQVFCENETLYLAVY